MFEQPDITRHQSRSGKTKHLPEGKIPGHDGQHRTDRQITHKAFLRAGFNDFIGQKFFRVLGIVAARGGALGRLSHGSFVGLAHFQRH